MACSYERLSWSGCHFAYESDSYSKRKCVKLDSQCINQIFQSVSQAFDVSIDYNYVEDVCNFGLNCLQSIERSSNLIRCHTPFIQKGAKARVTCYNLLSNVSCVLHIGLQFKLYVI